jgi:hypothetical protein
MSGYVYTTAGSYSYIDVSNVPSLPLQVPINNNSLIYELNSKYRVLIKIYGMFFIIDLEVGGVEPSLGTYSTVFDLFNANAYIPKNSFMSEDYDLANAYSGEPNYTVNSQNPLPLGGGGGGGGGGGAGSDPYITTFKGEIYELPELTKWWNLLTDDKMSIMAHTQNYPGGNFFNQVIVNYLNQKVIIDFNKRKIINKTSLENIKVGKVPYKFKFKNESGDIESEKDDADCVQIKDAEYKEILILVDWKNHYIVPKFARIPDKKMSGLFVNKPVSVKKYIK